MPTFELEQFELHTSRYRVEANSEAEAVTKLFNSEAEPVDGSLTFIEVIDDLGLPAEDCPELVQELRKLGVTGIDDVIPSVRSIDKIWIIIPRSLPPWPIITSSFRKS